MASELIDYGTFQQEYQESKNYARLAKLIIEEGTLRVKLKFKKNIIDFKTLPEVLQMKRGKLEELLSQGIITESQFQKLYPWHSNEPIEKDFDLTLWTILVRNLSIGKNRIDWKRKPQPDDNKWQHHVIRLRDLRNEMFHLPHTLLGETKFRLLWDEAAYALKGLESNSDTIAAFANCDLDELQTKLYKVNFQQQALDELHGMALVEARKWRSNWCLAVTFALLAVAVCTGLAFLVANFVKSKGTCVGNVRYITDTLSEEDMISYMSRNGWGAKKPRRKPEILKTPVPYVGIFHTALVGTCEDTEFCCAFIRHIQWWHQKKRGWFDIGYNYLIGGNGIVYEGRGSDYVGASYPGWNRKMISIAYIGMFRSPPEPSYDSLMAGKQLLEHLLYQGVIQENFTLYGQCQLGDRFPDSPGALLYEKIKTWKDWKPREGSGCANESVQHSHRTI